MSEQIVSRSATEIACFKRAVHNKEASTEIHWTSELGVSLDYTQGKFSQGNSQIVSRFMYLTKDDNLQPYISQDFITNNANAAGANSDDIGYVFDKCYQKKFHLLNQ